MTTKVPVELSSTPGIVDGSNATAITIDSSENVGIGNTVATTINSANASGNLVVGSGSGSEGITVYSGNSSLGSLCFADGTSSTSTFTGYITYNHSSNHMEFGAGDGTEKMRIDSSGKVGIGENSPSKLLHIASDTNYEGIQIKGAGHKQITIESTQSSKQSLVTFTTASQNMSIGLETDNAFIFHSGTASAERMRINSSGQLGVGTSTFDVYAQHVIQADYNQKVLDLKQNNASGRVLGLQYIPNGPDDSTDYYMVCSDANTNDMFIYSNGNLGNKNNSYGSSSDIKIKQNITDANSQWNDIKALQFKNYKLKSDVARYGEDNANTLLGLIAQDLETAGMNGLVYESKDEDSEGNKLDTVTKGIKYSVLYLKAVKALQEAMVKIEDLESRIETLER